MYIINVLKNKVNPISQMKHPYYHLIGQQIKKAREEAKISQKALAQTIGRESAAYIALIEAGKRKVSLQTLEKIAHHLNKPFNFFLQKENNHLDEREILKNALLMDHDLNTDQRNQILSFYDFTKLYKNKAKN